jgi:hypothetical protein
MNNLDDDYYYCFYSLLFHVDTIVCIPPSINAMQRFYDTSMLRSLRFKSATYVLQ